MESACKQFPNDDIFEEPFFTTTFIPKVRSIVSTQIEIADSLKSSDVHEKIENTMENLENNGYESDEASEAAWEQRKFLLRNFIEELMEESEADEEDQ